MKGTDDKRGPPEGTLGCPIDCDNPDCDFCGSSHPDNDPTDLDLATLDIPALKVDLWSSNNADNAIVNVWKLKAIITRLEKAEAKNEALSWPMDRVHDHTVEKCACIAEKNGTVVGRAIATLIRAKELMGTDG